MMLEDLRISIFNLLHRPSFGGGSTGDILLKQKANENGYKRGRHPPPRLDGKEMSDKSLHHSRHLLSDNG